MKGAYPYKTSRMYDKMFGSGQWEGLVHQAIKQVVYFTPDIRYWLNTSFNSDAEHPE